MTVLQESCEFDADCDGTRVCYVNMPWLEDGADPCLCLTFHGFQGADCTEFGSATVFQFVSVVMQFIAAVGLLLFSIRLCSDLVVSERHPCSLSSVTYYLLLLGVFFLVCWRLTTMLMLLSPEKFTRFQVSNFGDEQRFHELSTLEITAVYVAAAAGLLAFINTTMLCK